MKFEEILNFLLKLMNDNQGVVSVLIFIVTIFISWISGLFRVINSKPKFVAKLLPGPSFCCTFSTGEKFNGHDVHKTCFALYLKIANIGTSASSIDCIQIGYHWDVKFPSLSWLRYGIGWFWIRDQTTALSDFRVSIGSNLKVYPFLLQKNNMSPVQNNDYIKIGQAISGVIYYEQHESWGGCRPIVRNGNVALKIAIRDVFGKFHVNKVLLPMCLLEYARNYNPDFGRTRSELGGKSQLI